MSRPVVSVVIPTRNRGDYLEVALGSLGRQDIDDPWEAVVVDDGSAEPVPEPPGWPPDRLRLVRHEAPRGVNASRNSGVAATRADLIALVDDDVRVPAGWLRAVVDGARRHPEALAFGGPISARFEGRAPRGCGRDRPAITTLDCGTEDREVELVWGTNMAVRRAAIDRIGPFDEHRSGGGDEEEWLRRLRAAGGRIVYLAGAGLEHRRAGEDARLRALIRTAYRRGRDARAYDSAGGTAPSLGRELRVLAGCGWHTVRRACPQGLVMGAHSTGRTVEWARRR